MNLLEFESEDISLRHAIQTGVKYEQEIGEDGSFYRLNTHLANILKHIRTGLNCAMVEHAIITRLLLNKGLITEAEYVEVAREELTREIKKYEEMLSNHFGREIKLG